MTNTALLLTIDEVVHRTSLPRREITRLVKDGSFPEPVTKETRSLAWREADINAWIDSRPRVDGFPQPPRRVTH